MPTERELITEADIANTVQRLQHLPDGMEDARRLKVYLRQQTERIGTLEAALLAAGQTRDAAVGESERLLNLFREVIDTRVLSSSMQGWSVSLDCAYKALRIFDEAPAAVARQRRRREDGVGDVSKERVKIRSVVIDTSSPIEPRLKYVYHEGNTSSKQDDKSIYVYWDDGGLSVVKNDDNVTWLEG